MLYVYTYICTNVLWLDLSNCEQTENTLATWKVHRMCANECAKSKWAIAHYSVKFISDFRQSSGNSVGLSINSACLIIETKQKGGNAIDPVSSSCNRCCNLIDCNTFTHGGPLNHVTNNCPCMHSDRDTHSHFQLNETTTFYKFRSFDVKKNNSKL